MKETNNPFEMMINDISTTQIFSNIDFVDIVSFALIFLGMFLIAKWLFNANKNRNERGYWVLMLWINAVPIYIGTIILGFKYGFN